MDDKELYSLIEQFVDAEIERQKGKNESILQMFPMKSPDMVLLEAT